MGILDLLDGLVRAYAAGAWAVTLAAGLVLLAVDRPAYLHQGRRREAALAAALGWGYLVGGTALFLGLQWLRLTLDLG